MPTIRTELEISVLVVEDEAFTRTILSEVLTGMGFRLAGSAANAKDAMRLFQEHRPDVVLLDLDLGEGPTGIDIAQAMRRRDPQVGLAILSALPDPRLIRPNLPELPIATLYFQKKRIRNSDELLALVHKAFKTAKEQDPGMRGTSDPPESKLKFTDVQIELMRLVAIGASNAEIAKVRFTTLKSTETSIARLAKKLGIKNDDVSNRRVQIASAYYRLVRGL